LTILSFNKEIKLRNTLNTTGSTFCVGLKQDLEEAIKLLAKALYTKDNGIEILEAKELIKKVSECLPS
jgi:hypothetical protein